MSFSHAMRSRLPAGMPRPASLAALRDRIRQIELPLRHGVLPFGVPAIDDALPGGGLARGAVHEILGAGGDEEDGAAAAGFAAAILARIGSSPMPTSSSHRCAMGPSLSPLKGGEGLPTNRSRAPAQVSSARYCCGERPGGTGSSGYS